jgi:hypothetical protein
LLRTFLTLFNLMESGNSDNLSPDPERHHRSHSHASGHRSHHRHHRSSSSRNKSYSSQHTSGRKHRLEDLPRLRSRRRVESFFIKNILVFFGVIFLGGAIWFGYNAWKKDRIQDLTSTEQVSPSADNSVLEHVDLLSITRIQPHKSADQAPQTTTVLIVLLFVVFILSGLVISIRVNNILLRCFSFFAWICLALWLLIKLFFISDLLYFYSYIILSTLIFSLFFLSGLVDSYVARNRWKYKLEYILILFNSLFYLCTILVVFQRFGFRNYQSGFVFLLSTFHLLGIYYTDKKNMVINHVPYLLSMLFVFCIFLPSIFRLNSLLVFLSPLSVLLILFSNYSRNRIAILFSFFTMMAMFGIYLFQWGAYYIPGIIRQKGSEDIHLFFKGLIAGVFLWTAFAINNSQLAKINRMGSSPKWLKKSIYRKMVKGVYLIIIYLASYWVFQFFIGKLIIIKEIDILLFFMFNCLYFIVMIPVLAKQHSSYLRPVIIVSLLSTFIYPVFIHIQVMVHRNTCFSIMNASPMPFLLHYLNVAFLLILIYVLIHYYKRTFARMKIVIKLFWGYLYLMMVFLLLSEFDHLSVIYSIKNNLVIENTIFSTARISSSLIVTFSSFVVLFWGFKLRSRFLRISSIVIFSCVLIKILFYDISDLDNLTKTLFLFIFGVIILAISYSYSALKKWAFQKEDSKAQRSSSKRGRNRSITESS